MAIEGQHQQAGLGGDGHPHLVGHRQSAAPLPVFLGHEDLRVATQLLLLVGRQERIVRHVLLRDSRANRRETRPRRFAACATF